MMTDFDKDWPHGHVKRNGKSARIICTDLVGDYPIAAAEMEEEGEIVETYTEKGEYVKGTKTRHDLFNAPAPKRKMWVNVYSDMSCYLHTSRITADMASGKSDDRIACLEFEKGDGL